MMNEDWTPPDLYTLDWHEAWCKAHAEGKPMPERTDDPITGYYRGTLFENGPHVPYSYFYADGVLYCEVDNKVYGALEPLPNGQTPREAWQYVVKNPITGKQFMYYIDNGYWEEDAYLHTNNPPSDIHPDSVAAVENEIDLLIAEAQQRIDSGVVKDDTENAQVNGLLAKLREWLKLGKDRQWITMRIRMDPEITEDIIEKHVFYNSVGHRLQDAIARCEIGVSLKATSQTPYLLQQKAEAEAKGEKAPRQRKVMGVHATTLRTNRKAKIENYALCLAHFSKSPEIEETLQRLANAYARSTKQAPPGCKLVEEEIAS